MDLLFLIVFFIFLMFLVANGEDIGYKFGSMLFGKSKSRTRKPSKYENIYNQYDSSGQNNKNYSYGETWSPDQEGQKLDFIATVNDDYEIVIGKEYTDLLDLKSGDQFDIKIGRKGISLLKVELTENKGFTFKKQLSPLSHWSLSQAVDFQELVDRSIGEMSLDQSSKFLLNTASDLLIEDKPELANILRETSTLLSQSLIYSSQLKKELINTSNSEVILIMSLLRVPDRIRNIRYEEEFKNDFIPFLVSAEIQNLLIWTVLKATNIVGKDWNMVRDLNNIILLDNVKGKEQEFKEGFSSLIAKDNEEFWEKAYYPLMYLLKLELILKKSPSPSGLMNTVDMVMPSVIANLGGPNPADAFKMMEPIRNKMDELGVKGI